MVACAAAAESSAPNAFGVVESFGYPVHLRTFSKSFLTEHPLLNCLHPLYDKGAIKRFAGFSVAFPITRGHLPQPLNTLRSFVPSYFIGIVG